MADEFLNLANRADLQRLVDEGLEESLTLDYKASAALTRESPAISELCKDVSALANSAGGQIVYGIEEDKGTKRPSRVDEGVADAKISREWIEQILNSRIQPRMNGVKTTRIDMENGRYGYVITVPQSQIGPHQAPDQKYYRRFDLQSVAMHDYEIRDVRNRASTPVLNVKPIFVDTGDTRRARLIPNGEWTQPIIIEFIVTNHAATPAQYAVLLVYLDADVQVNGSSNLAGGRIEVAFDRMCRVFAANQGLPSSPPLFKENPEAGGSLFISLTNTGSNLRDFVLGTDIRAPGYFQRKRWIIRQVAEYISIEDTETI